MTASLDQIRALHVQRDLVCQHCQYTWPCHTARVLAILDETKETLDQANEILETAQHEDVDASMTAGLIQLRGSSRVLADLPGDRANILRDMLGDLIKERARDLEDFEPGTPLWSSTFRNHHASWGCGCDGTRCELRLDVGHGSDSHPRQTVRAICMTHGLHGVSDQGSVTGDAAAHQEKQAMQRLDLAHQEQCR